MGARAQDIRTFLNSKKEIEWEEISTNSFFYARSFKVMLRQPVVHGDTTKGFFKQRIWLSHIDNNSPMVLVTEGYAADRNYTSELASIVQGNQLVVEHRYFQESTPNPKDWSGLTVEQAAADHHAIVALFKEFYTGKWVSTGVSKGGSTCLFHRAFYPNDVDLTVPYVAPLNFGREDQRLFDFFDRVDDGPARKRMRDFQRLVLSRRDKLIPIMEADAKRSGTTFRMGIEKAFELAVLEFPFAMWQWGRGTEISATANDTDEAIYRLFKTGSDFKYVSDQSTDRLRSFFYQAYTELGYYAYVPGDLKPLMKAWTQDTISSAVLLPQSDTLTFRPEVMRHVAHKLRLHDPSIVAIVGESDPWGATSVEFPDLLNTLKIVKPEGSHLTRIKNLPETQRRQVYVAIERWLGVVLNE